MPISLIINTETEIFWNLPDGKPDRKMPPGTEKRIVRPAQKKETCFYYVTRLLADSDRVGQHYSVQKTEKRRIEKLFSTHRKKMTLLTDEEMPLLSNETNLLEPDMRSLIVDEDSRIMPKTKLLLELNLLSEIISDTQILPTAKPSAKDCQAALNKLNAINQQHSLYIPLQMQALKTLLSSYPLRYNKNQSIGEYIINYYRLTALMKIHEELLTELDVTAHTTRYPFNRKTEPIETQEGFLDIIVKLELIKKQGFEYFNCDINNGYSLLHEELKQDAIDSFPKKKLKDHDFSLFRKQLKEKGPFIIGGAFGETFYKNPPKRQTDLYAGRPVLYWSPGDYVYNQDPKTTASYHGILVVGAKEYKAENGEIKQVIFYHDPSIKSDPNAEEKTAVFSISFKALCERNIPLAPDAPPVIVKNHAASRI
jgi:hypothetical protein